MVKNVFSFLFYCKHVMKMKVKMLVAQLCPTLLRPPWTVACQAPLPMGFSRQEYWSGLPFLPSGNLPNPGTESGFPALQMDSLPSEPPGKSKDIMNSMGKCGGCISIHFSY